MAAAADSAGAAGGDAGACVIVLAPLGRDAAVVCQTLGSAGVACITVDGMAALVAAVRTGAGAVLVTDEALTAAGVIQLVEVLADEPPWSDLPVLLLLAGDDRRRPEAARPVAALDASRNVIVLQRPIPGVTLVTAVQAALRARRRQYELRDLLARERLAREEAESATRIKDAFLATVSHELRTPLSGILIWANLLAAGRLSAAQVGEAMRAIVSSAEAQSVLIEDLLDVSRMLTGKLRLEVRPTRLAPLVRAAVEVVRPMADAKGVGLDVGLEGPSVVVRVDADRTRQIVWNLLSNAVKFTPAGGTISIRLLREPGAVQIVVSDTGQGIAPEFLPHVFERFRQADLASQRRRSGLGLGLTIVHQLVELHGGSVEAHSPGEGHGATFTVRLPVNAGDVPDVDR